MAYRKAGWFHQCLVYIIGLFWGGLVTLRLLWLAVTKPKAFFRKQKRTECPTCLEDPSLGTHGYVRVGEVRLHYVAQGGSSKPLMLLLHGFPEFWYSWRFQIREFSEDYRVVAVDLRGYGESDKPSAVSQYTLDKLTTDIAQLVPGLGYEKCILVGHDWGGTIAWMLSAQSPHLVEKAIILNCPHPSAFRKTLRSSITQFMKSWYMFLLNLPYFPEWFFMSGDLKMLENAFLGRKMGVQNKEAFSQDDINAFKYTYNKPANFTGPMNYIRAGLQYLPEETEARIVEDTPVLLIWGTRDGALSTEMAEASGDYAVKFRLQFIEGASHWVQQDFPDRVNELVREFISDNEKKNE